MPQDSPPLEEMTLRQLRKVASDYNISRYSRMRKTELIAAIQQAMGIEGKKPLFNPDPDPQPEIIPSIESISDPNFTPLSQDNPQEEQKVEASKFELGQEDQLGDTLASVDEGLGELPSGYGDSRIMLLPRDPQWAYTYWDVPNEKKEEMRRQGGQQLALRIYDVTDINIDYQSPHSVQEYLCDELAREWYLPIPVSDRDYVIDIGYRCADGRFLVLSRSIPVHMPPVYPSDWIEDVFITVGWEEDLIGKTKHQLSIPGRKTTISPLYQQMYDMTEETEAQRVAGSLFGSMQHVAGSVVSSYVSQESSYALQETVSSYVSQESSYALQETVSSYVSQESSYALQETVSSYVSQESSYALQETVSSYVLQESSYALQGQVSSYALQESSYALQGQVSSYALQESSYALQGQVSSYALQESSYALQGQVSSYALQESSYALQENVSSYVFPSGVGLWAVPESSRMMSGIGALTMSGAGALTMSGAGALTMSGAGALTMSGAGALTMSGAGALTMSGAGALTMSGAGALTMSGAGALTMSGVGMGLNVSGLHMSGVGFSASAPPIRPRKFWLVADAELIVYGATEPDATVTVGGRPIKLNPDGTFRFQMSFQDGLIDYPIVAIASDGEQTRSIHMKFNRETPSRHTNTKDEAQLEWLT